MSNKTENSKSKNRGLHESEAVSSCTTNRPQKGQELWRPCCSRHIYGVFVFKPVISLRFNLLHTKRVTASMYCLQWLLPLLLIPRPLNPFMLNNHSMFMTLYLASFFLERRPCTICTVVFICAVFLICYSGLGNCIFFSECST